jgi:Tfp pilus assembly protein PilN
MIEINLLPGSGKKSRRSTGFSLGSFTASAQTRIKDPFLLAAIVSVVLSGAAIGGMFLTQSSQETDLVERERQAVQDSTRYVAVLRERRKAEAQRDSILRQVEIIKAIDGDRFVWPHILDEVSRALPPFTWLKSVNQLATTLPPAGTKVAADSAADSTAAKIDAPPPPLQFRVVGHTVDIQALTRFMKILEASPFVQNVQLARSELVMLDGKEVTEFQLDAEYERPDPAVLQTVPVSLSVR